MKTTKTLKIVFACLVSVAFFSGCLERIQQEEEHSVSLKLDLDVDESVIERNPLARMLAVPPADSFQIVIRQNGNVLFEYGHLSDMPDFLTLEAGDYEVCAKSEDFGQPAWDTPVYEGCSNFTVDGQSQLDVPVVCIQSNVAIQLAATDEFKQAFSNYSISVESDQGSLEFQEDDTRKAYFLPGDLTFSFMLVKDSGDTLEPSFTQATNPRELWNAQVTIVDGVNLGVGINVDAAVDQKEIIMVIDPVTGDITLQEVEPAPSYDYSETFDNTGLNGSYDSASFVGNHGVIWTYVESRAGDNNNIPNLDPNSLMLRGVDDDYLSRLFSDSISGGISVLSMELYKGLTSSGTRKVSVFINGDSISTSESITDDAKHLFVLDSLNVTGKFSLEVRAAGSKQIIVDNLQWNSHSE
ncbi:MAG: DUF4493 domain-containing protein [Cytophagales bacterium]|nr:DUF4493 domain-containing protein [Cytophagales bacterium]